MKSNPKIAVVITSISDGQFLDRFRPLLTAGVGSLQVLIAGDRKTPPSCATKAQQLASEGFDVRYLGLPEQAEILDAGGLAPDFVPFNSDNRRNVVVLAAWQNGADVVVSLDDDNFPIDVEAFLFWYRRVGNVQRLPALECTGRWVNPCALLDVRSQWTDAPVSIFARGYPHARRAPESVSLKVGAAREGRVLAHLGLWQGHPDVDAATRASIDPVSRGLRHTGAMLADTHARIPMSTQNVAVARALIPAWWYVRMGPMKSGRPLDRFGDMFQSYFASMVIESLGAHIAVGAPLVHHERNPHSLMRDLIAESSGMAMLEDLLPFIESVPGADSAVQAYRRIAKGLTSAMPADGGLLGEDARQWVEHTGESMVAWTRACERLDPKPARAPHGSERR